MSLHNLNCTYFTRCNLVKNRHKFVLISGTRLWLYLPQHKI
uniref:Uncharacterized protein n=1 Tax=Setaria italica TaxID=4555 RepID=K4A3M9_SETIT